MASSWMSNFAGINHTYLPTDNTNIDDLFKKKEEDTNVIKMIELKELLLDIIQGKEEIDLTEEDIEEIEGVEGGEDKKEIDTMVERVKKFIQEFIKMQNKLNQINELFQMEVKLLQQNISTIENMIGFLQKLPDEQKDETIMKSIIDSMNQLSQKILKNEKIKGIKGEYVKQRKEVEKYIYLIKKLNNFNQCNICPVCFTKTVDHFIDPCGHTFCRDCIQSLKKNPELDLYEIGRNDNSQCCYCRERIKTIRPLYFL